ncbi:MAG: NUDIX hydrolase [Myxococcota bacterium]|nr:NUDIX hydrolase [Myxococcota bacterium]
MKSPVDTPILWPNPPDGQTVYSEKRFSVRVCPPKSTGAAVPRGVIIHPGAVVLLPITSSGQIVMINNRRWQVGEQLLELAAGTLEDAEDPQTCAHRELEEETGYRCKSLTLFHRFYPLPGATTEVMHAYVARDLTHIGQSLESDEKIDVVLMDPAAVMDAMARGLIIDGKTLAVLGLYFLGTP